MPLNHEKISHAFLALTACLLFVLAPGFYLKGLLDQEREPSAMLGAMLRLASTSAQVTTAGDNPNHLLGELQTPNPITKYFIARGWQPIEPIQMGAWFYFARGDRRIVVKSRAFTGHYRYYEVTEKPAAPGKKRSTS